MVRVKVNREAGVKNSIQKSDGLEYSHEASKLNTTVSMHDSGKAAFQIIDEAINDKEPSIEKMRDSLELFELDKARKRSE